jgi:hypothetical protein
MIGNANGIDLNNATINQLSRIGGLGPVLAARIVDHRPFRRWADLEAIEGLDHEMVNDLRGSGAKLGRPRPGVKSKGAYNRVLRPDKPAETEAAARRPKPRSRRTRRARNIFSGEGQV